MHLEFFHKRQKLLFFIYVKTKSYNKEQVECIQKNRWKLISSYASSFFYRDNSIKFF